MNITETKLAHPAYTLLVVDDDGYNRKIIQHYLDDEPLTLCTAHDGDVAWQMMSAEPNKFDAVLMDRVMPKMDGLEVLKKMKKHDILKTVPVILQTSLSAESEILEGLKAGAFYYLTKPYKRKVLKAVVNSALADHSQYRSLRLKVREAEDAISLLTDGQFEFRTLDEGYKLATLLANVCPEPKKIVLGLWELLANAVEHGNLGITYAEKSKLNEDNLWHVEVAKRLALPENLDKRVRVHFSRKPAEIQFVIQDQGQGFDWRDYLELCPDRAFDSHGRGIAMAKMFSFDGLEYRGSGNDVVATLSL